MYSVPQDIQDMILYAYQHQEGVIRSSQHACVCVRVFACVCVYVCLFVCVCVCVTSIVAVAWSTLPQLVFLRIGAGVLTAGPRPGPVGVRYWPSCPGKQPQKVPGWSVMGGSCSIVTWCLASPWLNVECFQLEKLCVCMCATCTCVCVCVYLCVWYCSNVILIKGRFLDIFCPCLRNDNPKAFPSALHHVGHLFSASHLSLNMYNKITTR